MSQDDVQKDGLLLEVPGWGTLRLARLVLDFNGTLAKDGRPLAGVEERLCELAKTLEIAVVTADTFGTAQTALEAAPVTLQPVATGDEKVKVVGDGQGVVAIGNGRNDVEMLAIAALGIAVVGSEGCSCELIRAADVVAGSIHDALDLLLHPKRLIATLRS